MSNDILVKLPAYSWVNNPTGKLIVMLATTTGMMEDVFNRFFSRWDLSETMFNALLLLYKKEEMALWELGKEMLVSRANITGLMDRLEKRGLVTREINPLDRRSLTARLTEKAKKLVAEVIPQFEEYIENIMRGLNDREKQVLIELLAKVQNEILYKDRKSVV